MNLIVFVQLLWKSHRKSIIALGILLIFNLLLFAVVDQLLMPRVSDQERLFLQRQAEVRQLLHNQEGPAKSPEHLYEMASQNLVKFQQAVPNYQEFTALIEELLVLSSRARLNITQIAYSSEELKGITLLKYSLNFNVAGDYEQIKKFIHSLEQSVRLITIKRISLQGVDDESVSLQLILETYFHQEGRES